MSGTSYDFIVYDTDTGEIAYTGKSTDWQSQVFEPNQSAIEGVVDVNLHKISNGAVVDKTEAEKAPYLNFERKRTIYDERLRRVRNGFMFAGKMYDFDVTSQNRISGAASLANAAITAGAQTGDLRWHGGTTDFAWITQDNSFVPMDAPTLLSMGQAAAEHERAHVFAARALKDDVSIDDVTADTHWP